MKNDMEIIKQSRGKKNHQTIDQKKKKKKKKNERFGEKNYKNANFYKGLQK